MMEMAKIVRRYGTPAIVAIAGIFSYAFIARDAFKDVTQELIALFGLMMAGVLPTMVLTASVLRAGNLSVKKVTAYRDALRRQMAIWIGLFFISLVSSVFVIIGKISSWSLPLTIRLEWAKMSSISFDAIYFLNALIVMALALVVFRAIAVGNGIISLLALSAEIAISEAQARDDGKHRAAEASIANMPERPGFGEYIDLPH